jgi:hypothetical protein
LKSGKTEGGFSYIKPNSRAIGQVAIFFEVQHAQEHHIQKTTTCILSCQVFTHANAANSLLDNVTLFR